LACCLVGVLIYSMASCSDETDDTTLSGDAYISFTVSGIAQSGTKSLTRAQMEPQTVTQDLSDGTSIVYTLALDPAPVTRASMMPNAKYRVVMYKASDNSFFKQALLEAGTVGRIDGLENIEYKLVAYSFNTTADPGVAPTTSGTGANITVDPSNDLLHWTGSVDLTGNPPTPTINITFRHCFPLLTVIADASLTGDNITAVTGATVKPGYKGVLTLLNATGATNPAKGTSVTQTFSWTSLNANVVSSKQRPVFTYGETPVTVTFNNLTVGAKTVSPTATFSAATAAMQPGYYYTLTARFAPDPAKYECVIPLGNDRSYSYTKANGAAVSGQTTLTFLRYNLGANPEFTPKQQMAYPHDDTDRVYGGLFQWGRANDGHSQRGSKDYFPEYFRNEQYESYDGTQTKFVWGTGGSGTDVLGSNYWWYKYDVSNSNMWGNGGGLSKQTDFRPSQASATPFATANSTNPCPTGYRVPTEHEWALILNEGGTTSSSSSEANDYFDINISKNISENGTTWYIPSKNTNVVWVRVSNGHPSTAFGSGSNNMNGWAIYDTSNTAINSQSKRNTVFVATTDLTADAAPTPLMFLPAAGCRDCNTGAVADTSYLNGYYWSSTVNGDTSYLMSFNSSSVYANDSYIRANGCSVRCVKE